MTAAAQTRVSSAERLTRLLAGIREDERSCGEMLFLTANENLMSRLCRSLLVSPLGDRYHLGTAFECLPSSFLVKGGLMLKGLPHVCALEQAAHAAAREMFGAELSDFRPLSGVHTTLCTLSLMTRPGETVYSIAPRDGGHFATRSMVQRLGRRSRYLPADGGLLWWDGVSLARMFRREPPCLILLDSGAVLAPPPIATLRAAAGPRCRILYDGSHSMGLIAGGVFPNPLREGCDVLQGNTHKTFPGPQKGMLHFKRRRLGETVCKALSGGFISSQHTAHSLALYVALLEMREFGREYARQMVANAVALGTELEKRGFELLRAGDAPTKSNMILIADTGRPDIYLACETLLRCGISTNARPLYGRAMLRIGTQEVTRRGMREPEMQWIAELMAAALTGRKQIPALRREVAGVLRRYGNIHYSFDEAMGLWP